ncbi:uncharacterized protein [Fopius arisanus]|uniref:BEN domain-containing protein n=1 Tax=Fopius arisanus TaxID=64838 RepID=A0A9R1T5X2_9HYME|nr:PREDICTED: uncharacterized protein LOC105267021 [Fopius arisanus]
MTGSQERANKPLDEAHPAPSEIEKPQRSPPQPVELEGQTGLSATEAPIAGPSGVEESLDRVHLIEGSDVLISSHRLRKILYEVADDHTSSIRRLLNELVGVEKLKTMRATGKGGWTYLIPPEILDAIEDYVVSRTEGKMTHKKFMRVVTTYLNYLRHY